MIVKNEAHVIKRCLGSVKPWIDHWTIVDTGSNDGTQSLVREVLCDIPGSLFERPWIDFSVNRSESIALASPFSDYLLIIDADDTLEVESKFAFPLLSRDAYTLTVHDAGHLYRRLHIIRTSLPWRYEGVLHEYLECSKPYNSGHIDGLRSCVGLVIATKSAPIPTAIASHEVNHKDEVYAWGVLSRH
ncbi:MAG: hypothetical protein NTY42_13770 [Planctomycetota bacterium]|nr:hypothetical protein [Planctomycetota bacterium]